MKSLRESGGSVMTESKKDCIFAGQQAIQKNSMEKELPKIDLPEDWVIGTDINKDLLSLYTN